jgi:protein translocase SecG subunit
MQNVIIAIHLMVVAALVALVLYQKSEGGALGLGSSGFMTGRGQANALTRATGILGTIFFLTSIALTVLPAWQRGSTEGADWTKAIDQGDIKLKEVPAPAPDAAKEGQDSIFEQLRRAQEQRQKEGAGAPATPPAEAPKSTEAPKATPPLKPAEAPKAVAPAAPDAAKEGQESIFDQLRRAQEERQKALNPAAPAEAPKATESLKTETPAPAAPPSAEAEKPALRPSQEPMRQSPAKEPEAKAAAATAPATTGPGAFAPSWLQSSPQQGEKPKSEPAKNPKAGSEKGAAAPSESKDKPAVQPPTIWKAPTQ